MPTYEYRCKDCGEHLEVVQSFKDDPLTECPNCQGALRKVFGNVGIVLKGSGFYKTDSRSAGAKSSSGSGSSSGGSSSSGSDSSSSSSAASGSDSGSSSSDSGSSSGSSSSASSPASTAKKKSAAS